MSCVVGVGVWLGALSAVRAWGQTSPKAVHLIPNPPPTLDAPIPNQGIYAFSVYRQDRAAPIAIAQLTLTPPDPARPSTVITPAPIVPDPKAVANIQVIDLSFDGRRLTIQVDRPLSYRSQWQGDEYLLIISPARLAEQVRGSQLLANGPIRRVHLRSQGSAGPVLRVAPYSHARCARGNWLSYRLSGCPAPQRSRVLAANGGSDQSGSGAVSPAARQPIKNASGKCMR